MNKKGVLGLDTVRDVMLAFLVISVIAVAVILTMFSLQNQEATIIDFKGLHVENESIGSLNSSYWYPMTSDALGEECSATIQPLRVYNNTVGPTHEIIIAANYTVSNCSIKLYKSSVAATTKQNNSQVNISYTFNYKQNTTDDIGKNLSASTSDFFSNTGTIFSILVVIVIILAIAIIIAVVSRFGGAKGVTGGAEATGGSSGKGTVMGI